VSILCQDERVFEAMLMAGTPCPFEGKIGKEAIAQWNKYDVERPDYQAYISKLETRSQIDAELEAIEQVKRDKIIFEKEQQERIAVEKAAEELRVLEEEILQIDLETKEEVIIRVHN